MFDIVKQLLYNLIVKKRKGEQKMRFDKNKVYAFIGKIAVYGAIYIIFEASLYWSFLQGMTY